jgi:uncharacterized protein YciI
VAAIHVLTYAYVDDIVELRAPHREAHLAHIERCRAEGALAMAGATGDPPTGALFVFEADSADAAQEFAEADPYVAAGLVTAAMIEPWNLVAHRDLEAPGA